MSLKHLKERCAGCERIGVKMNKEHIFPKWLIMRTGTDKTGIRWGENPRLPALAVTVPLCVECNRLFGEQLESPVAAIFDDLEARRGISDLEAELLVRWMWKITGLSWIATHPYGKYNRIYTLRERVLRPIDALRGDLILALSLIEAINPSYGDKPLGVDSTTEVDAVFASGVFSKIAIMAVHAPFAHLIPQAFSLFRLLPNRDATSSAKLCHPKVGFKNDTEAVSVTMLSSIALSEAHDKAARRRQRRQ